MGWTTPRDCPRQGRKPVPIRLPEVYYEISWMSTEGKPMPTQPISPHKKSPQGTSPGASCAKRLLNDFRLRTRRQCQSALAS